MSIETTVYAALVADSTVSALCGNRVYPLLLPQNPVLPAVTYQRISTRPVNTRQGNGLDFVRLQFDCYAETYAGAKTMAAAVDGALGDSGIFQQLLDGFDDTPELFRVSLDFTFAE